MTNANSKLLTRGDTFLGVCEGLGEEFGVNSTWFRVAFLGLLFWNWQVALAIYPAVAVMIYAVRWLMPTRRVASPAQQVVVAEHEQLPLAA